MKNNNCEFPIDSLVEVMETLRSEQGCPWDKQQTHESLKKYLLEETYEVLDAIDEKNMHKLCEEMGDLLLQIAFHAQISREKGHFDMNDVVKGITQKLIRRHPHVFAGESAETPEQVVKKWEEIKSQEQDKPKPLLDVPKNFPALFRAQKIQEKAARVGFDWPDINGAWEKVSEEITELKEANIKGVGQKEELGDVLFAVVNLARFMDVNAEEALRDTIDKFVKRFSYIEDQAKLANLNLKDMTLGEMDQLWEEAKVRLK